VSKKANPTVVGLFVLGGIGLAVAALLAFGSGRLFKPTYDFVMYFDGSVAGLDVGAPVEFRGVRVGTVTDILLVSDNRDLSLRIPIHAQLEPERWVAATPADESPMESFRDHIEKGMRAQLQSQSLLTGKLKVVLDYFPDKPAVFRDPESAHPEIPTIPGTIEQLTRRIEELPLREIVLDTHDAVRALNDLLRSPDTAAVVSNLNYTLNSIEAVALKLERLDLEAFVTETRRVFEGVDASIRSGHTAKALETLNATLLEGQRLAADLRRDIPDMRADVREALDEFTRALRALRLAAEHVERHPESLLRGKPPPRREDR
jgi:paraquat-inducible protein B